jgi:hypothetical protein
MNDELPDRAGLYIKVAVGAAGVGNGRCGVGTKQREGSHQWRSLWWRRGAGLAHRGRQKGCRRQGRWVSGWHRDEQRYDWKEDCQFVTEATDLHPRIQHQRNWTHNIIISTNFIKFTRRIVDWVWELADYYMWVFMILWRTRPHLGNRYIYKSECVTWSYNLVGVHFTKIFNQ